MAFTALTIIGFGLMVQIAASNTLLQTIVEEDKRGRIMSFFTMAFLGMAPLGSLLTGYVAETLGIAFVFIMNGCIYLLSALVFFVLLPRLRELIRPIYMRLNIISPLVAGIEAASELELITKE
jgi:MFS family permease